MNKGGEWLLRLEDTAATATDFHAWSTLKKGPTFVAGGGITVPASTTVSPYAVADNVIVVGAYATEGSRNGELAGFSSRGPLLRYPPPTTAISGRTCRRPASALPRLPRKNAEAAAATAATISYDYDGTSQAAPHVTGAVALMLQKNGTLSFTQIRDFLKKARQSGGKRYRNNDWGWGKLDVKASWTPYHPPGAPKTPAPPPPEPAVAVRFSTPASPLLSLRDEFFSVPKGRFYNDLVTKHFTEVHALINTNRRVATVWHRNGGPALIRMGMLAAYQQEQPLPVEIEGIRLSDRLNRIADIIKRYGSENLIRDIDEHVKEWIAVVGEGFSVRQLFEIFKEKEASVPVMA